MTQNWPTEQERMNNDMRLSAFQGLTVGGKKSVATVKQPIEGDNNTGSSNLQTLVESNYGPEAKMALQGRQTHGFNGEESDCKNDLRTLKGELIACCGTGVGAVPLQHETEAGITSNLPFKGPSPM